MKKLVIVLGLLAGFNAAYAGDELPVKNVAVKAMDGLKFKVAIPELSDKGTIAIKNGFGETIYKEVVGENPSFVKIYSLAGFPDGNYYFEVKVNDEVVSKEVKINTVVSRVSSVK